MKADVLFLDFGMQYYVAARSSVLAQQTPVPANLFHHAIENLIKAHLSQVRSLRELKRQFSHDLPKAWKTFKAEVKDRSELHHFDKSIQQLHAFEDLRYPDSIVQRGATIVIGGSPSVSPATTPKYSLSMNEMDRLVVAILKASSRNPKFFTTRYNEYAREALTKDNPVAALLIN